MSPPSGHRTPGARRILLAASFVIVVAGLAALAVVYRRQLWSIFKSPEDLRAWVASFGVAGPAVFVGLQAAQVVVFVIPGEVPQVAGGYLFGTWIGTLLSLGGIAVGSTGAFFLARVLGVPFVRLLFEARRIERIRAVADSRRARVVFFLLFLIPGIPKDILCYAAGLSRMRYVDFLWLSMAGRLPGILGSAIIGNAAAQKRWLLALCVFGGSVLLFAAGYLLRERISGRLERMAGSGKGSDGSGEEPRRQ